MVVIIFMPFVTDICVPTIEAGILCLKVPQRSSCLMAVLRAPGFKGGSEEDGPGLPKAAGKD